jgi:hypothetical protein
MSLDVNPMFYTPTVAKHEKSVTGNLTQEIAFTVPDDEKWYVLGFTGNQVSGTFNWNDLCIMDRASLELIFHDTAPRTGFLSYWDAFKGIWMKERDDILYDIGSFTGAGTQRFKIYYIPFKTRL